MCNTLHRNNDYQKIPRTGTAWKICIPINKDIYAIRGRTPFNRTGPNIWSHELGDTARKSPVEKRFTGFCGFMTHAEAQNAVDDYSKQIGCISLEKVYKVTYTGGIGSCMSTELDGIARRFVFFKNFTFTK